MEAKKILLLLLLLLLLPEFSFCCNHLTFLFDNRLNSHQVGKERPGVATLRFDIINT